MYKRLFNLLPERMRKPTTKDLYYVLFDDMAELKRAITAVKASRDIDVAYGETLDRIGSNVGQFRLDEDDDLYRQLIKVRIIANLSIGDIPTINEVMSILVKDIYLGLREAWDYKEYEYEPSKIVLQLKWGGHTKVPYKLVQEIKAAGVRVLEEVLYFSDSEWYFGSAKRELMTLMYEMYTPTALGRELRPLFAGRVIREYKTIGEGAKSTNIRAKGIKGMVVTSDKEEVWGV